MSCSLCSCRGDLNCAGWGQRHTSLPVCSTPWDVDFSLDHREVGLKETHGAGQWPDVLINIVAVPKVVLV